MEAKPYPCFQCSTQWPDRPSLEYKYVNSNISPNEGVTQSHQDYESGGDDERSFAEGLIGSPYLLTQLERRVEEEEEGEEGIHTYDCIRLEPPR